MRAGARIKTTGLWVLYDAGCELCGGLADLVRALDWRDRLSLLPLQTPGLLELLALPAGAPEETLWAIGERGELLRNVEAVAAILDAYLPLPRPVLGRLLRHGRVLGVAAPLFHLVSDNRPRAQSCAMPAGGGAVPRLTAEERGMIRERVGRGADDRRTPDALLRLDPDMSGPAPCVLGSSHSSPC